MKFKSEVLTQASGSIGGTTYAHNRGGLYRRARSIPTNPNSTKQQAARAAFASASQAWAALTTGQRDAWAAYAQATPLTNVFGDEQILSGQQMYVRNTAFALRCGLAALTDAPTTPGLAQLTDLVWTVADDGSAIGGITDSDAWANSDSGRLLVSTSPYLSAGVNFIRSPMSLVEVVDGNATTAPTVVDVEPNGFGQSSLGRLGQKIGYNYRVIDGEGRLSRLINTTVEVISI